MFSFYEHSLDNVTVYRENYRRNYRRVWVFSDRRHTVSRCNLLEKSGEISRLITGDMQHHCLHEGHMSYICYPQNPQKYGPTNNTAKKVPSIMLHN